MITDHSDLGESVDGGVQAVTRYLVGALARRGDVDLHVVSFRYGNTRPRSEDAGGYTRHVLPGARLGTVTAFRRDQGTLGKLLASIRPDVVHGQGAGHNGIMAARSPYPSVITVHGIMSEEAKHLSGLGNRIRHWLLSRISNRYCIAGGRHTILITPYVADYFGSRLAGKQYFIPNPIADAFFSITREETTGRVLFAGRLYRLKGVLDLFEAAARVGRTRHVELRLAGSLADWEYVAQLRKAADDLGIADRVAFLGLLDEQALQRELGTAAVLVLPSYQETAPMVIVEAMAAGVPVIASDVGGTRHLVADGETGYVVNPRDISALADRLERVLADEALRRRFGEASRTRAGEIYSADRVAEQTLDVYRRIVDEAS